MMNVCITIKDELIKHLYKSHLRKLPIAHGEVSVMVSYLIKLFPIWCNVKFSLLFFVLFNAVKTDIKLTLHHMGKFFIIQFTMIKFKIWRVTFLKSF